MRHPTHLHSGDFAWAKVRVLVFSGNDAFRFLVRQTFRKLNVREVLSASIPADADPLMGQMPDIALVDVDGDAALALAFLERVRAAAPEMPVLVVAKPGDKRMVLDAVPQGVDGFLPKPVSGHELGLRVAEAIKAPKRVPLPHSGASTAPSMRGTGSDRQGEAPAVTPSVAVPSTRPAPGGSEIRPGSGTYGSPPSGDDPVPAKPVAEKLTDADLAPVVEKSRRETFADSLPEALRPKHKADAAARAAWQEELAQSGHAVKRRGKDVAALNVDGIVAAHVQWLTSQGAQGKRADFRLMDLGGIDLAGTVLANAGFREVELGDATLAEARLDGADFRYAKLGAADLAGAELSVAHLRHADLRLANLQGASLRGADLSGARLSGANLAGADFKGAMLVGSDLAECDLSQAENLAQAQVDKALCDMKTKLPPGVRRPTKAEE